MITLGIETSCDETALALIETRYKDSDQSRLECRVISSLVHSQAELHSAYGGVFPSLAKREHGKNLVPLLHKLFEDTGFEENLGHGSPTSVMLSDEKFTSILETFKENLSLQNPDLWQSLAGAHFLKNIPKIDRIAITEGPGLEPALWVGINFGKIISALWNIPLIAVNHMEGHIYGSLLEAGLPFGTWQEVKRPLLPALVLLISGGHTELVKIDEKWTYSIIGATRDDAVGEAFDKAARLLGLPYPGGPHISMLADLARKESIESPIQLPRPMLNSKDLDFSYSGLKTALLYAVRDLQKQKGSETLDEVTRKGLAREFEEAVAETLLGKVQNALEQAEYGSLIIGGGVSANRYLIEKFKDLAVEHDLPLYLPSKDTSGDNALMIALAGAVGNKTEKVLKADGTMKLS
ncbi:MAG: tRNA (adenosine(37)-N6)-threonylcarbamoyltransferase complex transferase subunit TsaD [Candidatus Paceibacterota bacterium]